MNIKIEKLDNTCNFKDYCNLMGELSIINLDTINEVDFINYLNLINSNPHHNILIAKLDDEIIGSITILIEPKTIHNFSFVSHIEDVVVKKKYRSQGIGKKLVDEAINLSNNYNCYKIILNCSDKNIPFYEKCGFVLKETQMALYLEK